MTLLEELQNVFNNKMAEFNARLILCKEDKENPDYPTAFYNEELENVSLSKIIDYLPLQVVKCFYVYSEIANTTYHYITII